MRLGHPLVLMYLPPLQTLPMQWTEDQVYRWAEWTVQEFKLTSVNLLALKGISGHQLCSFTRQQFYELGYTIRDVLFLQQLLNIIKTGKQARPNLILINEIIRQSLAIWQPSQMDDCHHRQSFLTTYKILMKP